MKGMVMAGMMALCLVLGLWATLGDAWLEADEDEMAEDMTSTSGLNNVVVTMSELDGECDAALEALEDMDDSDA